MARRSARVTWLGFLVAAVLACAGCGDEPTTESAEPPKTTESTGATEPTEPTEPTDSTSEPTGIPETPETSESSSPSPTSAPQGTKITGSGYSYHVPKGWGPPPQDIPGLDPDSLAVDLQDGDGFADNVNVLVSPVGKLTPQQAEDGARTEFTATGAKDVSVNDRVTVAGSESAHLSAVMSVNDNTYSVEQFYVSDEDQTFVVTFSFSRSVTAGERTKVTNHVLASWSWSDDGSAA